MEESTQEIQKYIDNLVPVVKNAVLSPEWRKRVGEIGQKYTLTADQISSLEYEVLFVLIGMEPGEDLVANIQNEVRVSGIIAGQITEEVDARIFQYILKMMENRITNNEVRNTNKTEEKPNSGVIHNSNTELRSTTPLLTKMENMVGETNHEVRSTRYDSAGKETPHQKEVAPPMNLPGVEEEEDRSTNNEVRDTNRMQGNIPDSTVIRNSNFELRPTPSFADAKLNSTVTSTQQTVVKGDIPVQKDTPIVKSYSADPYREPLE